jgi:hypothetical protein
MRAGAAMPALPQREIQALLGFAKIAHGGFGRVEQKGPQIHGHSDIRPQKMDVRFIRRAAGEAFQR